MLKAPLTSWQRHPESLQTFFTPEEGEKLEEARSSIDLQKGLIVYCVYENPFAKSGGIFTVAENYCATLRKKGVNLIALTPYHERLKTAPHGSAFEQMKKATGRQRTCKLTFNNQIIEGELFEHTHLDVPWIFLRANGFFEASGGESRTDPYIHEDSEALLADSLFMSAAIPHILAALGYKKDLIIHLQDWELAAGALTVKEAIVNDVLESAAVVLSTHNPYDHALSDEALRWITPRPYRGALPTHTIYQYMIPLIDAPLNTVSRTFAHELTTDPLQTDYFTNHLQETFKYHGLIGIDNGIFGDSKQAFSEFSIERISQGLPEAILSEKRTNRLKMLKTLSLNKDPRIIGFLSGEKNRTLETLAENIPVFVMFGRLDPGQKGFDLLAQAIKVLPPEKAKFILTPIIAGASPAFQEDLKALVEWRPGDVVVYPFRLEQGYAETMAGATYAIMPSFYEPFGGATEAYLSGTPVVARATGGLAQQVVDIDSDPENGTGLLFREKMIGPKNMGAQWQAIETATDPKERKSVVLYTAMIEALAAAVLRACDIYQYKPETYARMLANLYPQAQKFSWDRTCEEYRLLYELAVTA